MLRACVPIQGNKLYKEYETAISVLEINAIRLNRGNNFFFLFFLVYSTAVDRIYKLGYTRLSKNKYVTYTNASYVYIRRTNDNLYIRSVIDFPDVNHILLQ